MFNPTAIVIEAFVDTLRTAYHRMFGIQEPDYPDIIGFIGRMALEKITISDAPYHDLSHTILVTDVGQAILQGKHVRMGGVTPNDWLNFIVSLLCHDIGYVRGVCKGDGNGAYVIDADNRTITLPPGATDAFFTPYHVDRSKLFVQQRFHDVRTIDVDIIMANIEHTRFPVPDGDVYKNTGDYPGLLRAADLIGQLADISYPRKIPALFAEFQETGMAHTLGYKSAADLRKDYPKFYWKHVSHLIQEALQFLGETQEGKQWVAMLYAHVFQEEHALITF